MNVVLNGYYKLGARLADPHAMRTWAVIAMLTMLLCASMTVMAGVGGVEFDPVFDWLNNSISGSLGRAIVTGGFIVFAMVAAGRQAPMLAMGAAVLALIVGFGPGIVQSFVTGVI
jgi:hypothetical protein